MAALPLPNVVLRIAGEQITLYDFLCRLRDSDGGVAVLGQEGPRNPREVGARLVLRLIRDRTEAVVHLASGAEDVLHFAADCYVVFGHVFGPRA